MIRQAAEQLKELAIKTQDELRKEQEELETFDEVDQVERWDEWTSLYERVNYLIGKVDGYVESYCLLVYGDTGEKQVRVVEEEWFNVEGSP